MKRRETVATAGALLSGGVAGCVLPFRDTVAKVSEGIRLEVGQYNQYDIDIEGENATLDYTIDLSSGPEIDAILMDRNSFEEYQNENYDAVSYHSEISAIGTRYANNSGDLTTGSYTLLLDNTDNIGTKPPADATAAVISVDYLIYR